MRNALLVIGYYFLYLVEHWLCLFVFCAGACCGTTSCEISFWDLETIVTHDLVIRRRLVGRMVILLKLLIRRLDGDCDIEILLLSVAICLLADTIMTQVHFVDSLSGRVIDPRLCCCFGNIQSFFVN